MTISVFNPNAVAMTGVAFTNTYPSGLTGATTAQITGTNCTGTLTATSGSLALTGGTVPPNTTCSYSVVVTGTTAGAKSNSVTVTSTNPPSATAAATTVNVYAPPTVAKAFTPETIEAGVASGLVIYVSNPGNNPGNINDVEVEEVYTGTLVNVGAASISCGAGSSATLTGGINGGKSVGIKFGTFTPGGDCVITQYVTATSTGTYSTTAPTATAAGGTVALTGTAVSRTLTVLAPTLTKSWGEA
jgi:hypothetical protein